MINLNKVKGCLIGGAVGDALGFPIEFNSITEIRETYGPAGLTDYVLNNGIALISDDTQMTLFTANGLLTAKRNSADKWPAADTIIKHIFNSYKDWYLTQTENYPLPPNITVHSELTNIPELFSRRAPGRTCMEAIRDGKIGTVENPLNNSKGCGGLMRVAPVALALYDTNLSSKEIALIGAEAAAITHGHKLGYMPAAALVYLLTEILRGDYLHSAVKGINSVLLSLFPFSSDLQRLLNFIDMAQTLAKKNTPPNEAFEELGEGWIAEETLAISIFCALKYENDFEKGILESVNLTGDSDSTGCVTGQILGAALGFDAIPAKFITHLELKDTISKIADELCSDVPPRKTA